MVWVLQEIPIAENGGYVIEGKYGVEGDIGLYSNFPCIFYHFLFTRGWCWVIWLGGLLAAGVLWVAPLGPDWVSVSSCHLCFSYTEKRGFSVLLECLAACNRPFFFFFFALFEGFYEVASHALYLFTHASLFTWVVGMPVTCPLVLLTYVHLHTLCVWCAAFYFLLLFFFFLIYDSLWLYVKRLSYPSVVGFSRMYKVGLEWGGAGD